MRKLSSLLRRAMAKPLPVVAFRLRQALQLAWMARTGAWARLARRAEHQANRDAHMAPVLLCAGMPALSEAQQQHLADTAKRVLTSQFELFGQAVPNLERCDFAVDWRFEHRWAPQYFKRYQFYEHKETPYDVKFPWELSRLHYLVPVLAWQLSSGADQTALGWVRNLLKRWRRENPLAHSVNWYPMEASMRVISLVLLRDLVVKLQASATDDAVNQSLSELSGLLRCMVREHGDFVWINREFTDVRGNHFTANLVALLLAAQTLGEQAPADWRRYADHWMEKEIGLQFCADGVNFEKSCGYHKLVLELFLLAAVARQRAGDPLSADALSLLSKAAAFSDAVTRPDGLAANFGDTDDAVALPFLIDQPRSHGAVVELARAFFEQAIGSHRFVSQEALAARFLIGRQAPAPEISAGPETQNFPDGGYVVVRNSENGYFCMVDVGEVGMAGRGGHGHNDLLAFELCIDGHPVVVDPGCSGYTADLEKKTRYRSTAAHASVQLFDDEMARFAGHWAIHNDARPQGVTITVTDRGALLSAGHNGYSRLAEGCTVRRKLDMDAKAQTLEITDELSLPQDNVPVRWHYPVGENSVSANGGEQAAIGNGAVALAAELPLQSASAPFSDGYGQEVAGNVVTAESMLAAGTHTFRFSFRKQAMVDA